MRLPLILSALAVSSLSVAPSSASHKGNEKIHAMRTVTFGAGRASSEHGLPQRRGSITLVMR